MHFSTVFGIACACLQWDVLASLVPDTAYHRPLHPLGVNRADAIATASRIVEDAISRMSVLNKARLDHPARNLYKSKPGSGPHRRGADGFEPPPPLLVITPEIAAAAALLAEEDAATTGINGSGVVKGRAGGFWMGDLSRKGSVPWGKDSSYKVFRNVVADYGADPTGQKDSTSAIQKAISDGQRCGSKCYSSTTKNAIVYIPSGTYLISSSISVYFGTQVIGDATHYPILKASSRFVGLGVLSTDVYEPNGGTGSDGLALEWYVNTARFYSQIRNLRIDITATRASASICAVHYQVAQATSIENVELIAKAGTTQRGMFAENGSGGVMSDVVFTGGDVGFYGGNQQFTASRMTFKGCRTAAQIIWDWGWVWKSTTIDGADVGFRLMGENGTGNIGSVSFMDSTFSNIKTSAIVMNTPADKPGTGSTGLVLDNVNLGGRIVDSGGKEILGSGYYKNWVIGATYSQGKRTWQSGKAMDYTREQTLLGPSRPRLDVAPYLERPRPQYEGKSAGDFVHLKDEGAQGDGSTDDTAAVQAAFKKYGDGSKIIYVDAGTYLLTDTVTVPTRAKIVGEAWAQLAASGSNFADASNPRPMLRVGASSGDEGDVEMQDLILTTKGGTAGVVLMEWNVRGSKPGAAALWDVHARVGGATGTGLTAAECPPITSGTNPVRCQAASLLLHVTPKASGYFDNMWLWVADHDLDDLLLTDSLNAMTQVSVYSARGFLIESRTATWLYGTASEHNVYYQYNFHAAKNIFTTMIQSESPYYQPVPKPPAPFSSVVGKFVGDPDYTCKANDDFSGCDESWAVILQGSGNIHVASAGTYSWFDTYSQTCIDGHACQQVLWLVNGNYDNVRLSHIVGIGAKYIMVAEGKGVSAADNLAVSEHPAWSHISLFEVESKGAIPDTSDDNLCDDNDRMWSDKSDTWTTPGSYMPWMYMEPEYAASSNKYYVTIVNLTPYRFVLTSTHKCQFDTWDFGHVPSGRARQNTMEYTKRVNADAVDDNAEAYFSVEGTDKRFTIRGTTHIPDDYPWRTVVDLSGMGLGQREFGDPAEETSVTVIITGSEEFGYRSSINFPGAANWMHSLYDVMKDRKLRHVVMPGSHDAGMTTISKAYQYLGSKENTQTQGLSIYDQLRAGSRWFDLRIVTVDDGSFWAAHLSGEHDVSPYGATGQSFDSIVDDINSFTSESPGEIIFLPIRYMSRVRTLAYPELPNQWDAATVEVFYSKLAKLRNRCPNIRSLKDVTAGELMDSNNGGGCVIPLIAEGFTNATLNDRPSAGIYNSAALNINDHWSNKDTTEDVAEDQVANMQAHTRGGDDQFDIMQWVVSLTASDFAFADIASVAILPTNPALYWRAVNAMSPEIWPTVIMQDYVGYIHMNEGSFPSQLGAEIQTLCYGLNLYMVSQNCKASRGKNPLLKPPASEKAAGKKAMAASGIAGMAGMGAFQGVIYANGTVDYDPPKDFHVGQVQADCRDRR